MARKKRPSELTPEQKKEIPKMHQWALLNAKKHPKEFEKGFRKYWLKYYGLD